MRDVQCKRCIEYKGNWCDKKRDDPDPDMVRDCHWFRTKTNADRIRAMTDEELALYLVWTADPDTLIVDYRLYECHDRSIEDTLDWLKQEVGNDTL